MMVTAQCPYCFATDEVPKDYAGRVTKCMTCGKTFTIKFVPALYRESATPVVVTPKKAITMGLPPDKPRADGLGAGPRQTDAQSQQIFAELSQATPPGPQHEKRTIRDDVETSLVGQLDSLDTAMRLAKAIVGLWAVGLLTFAVYTGVNGQYVATLMALGVIGLLAVGVFLLRVIDDAFTQIIRRMIDLESTSRRAAREQAHD